MGKKLSVVQGVKSENYTTPGNAVNEIWVGDTELISRLPFGSSDMDQASWPTNGVPKIPWHNFIIPMKRDLETLGAYNSNLPLDFSGIARVPPDQLVCCNQRGCITDQHFTQTVFTAKLVSQDYSHLDRAILLTFCAIITLNLYRGVRRVVTGSLRYSHLVHDFMDVWYAVSFSGTATMLNIIGLGAGWWAISAWSGAHEAYQFKADDWKLMEDLMKLVLFVQMLFSVCTIIMDWLDVLRVLRRRSRRRSQNQPQWIFNVSENRMPMPQKPPAALV
ncbi:predicted protein [Aspergillus nidulans FGSC A4]|uniref:Uncharacterized protein n=1 Tax=Emericella nidulans (strain FGSC A4 / ATCC 38163 / CBS 112.46 / NRRL 194 / M139) TaxID=227321 RepID=Q5BG74_EMENI|nr:hypothetical protein [Aspergillus nidulans FGSC A4]EAA66555.1 predicted protein [Aspergillus nidulans FGSC A4]CBF89448.1 TPA: conserved hypothetical protein [Aspergillus nidulans FGSC A4]|eukprot:XP_658060.1 predicted protein [Aspergillus nidulans FGSC A4]